jgi:uncharacterized protein (DUF983 family)
MLGRGLRRRCARCGGEGLFHSWFRIRDRCPRCGYLFAREEGFWLGAYVMNLAVTEGLLALLGVVPAIALLAANPDASVIPVMVAGLVAAVVGPLAFHPFSRTIWVAIELIMRPASEAEPGDRL